MDPSTINIDEFGELIGMIYEEPFESTPWLKSLYRIREILEANHVTLMLRPSTSGDPGVMYNAGETNDQAVVSYGTTYYALDPFVSLPRGEVHTVHEILGEERWLNSAFYKQFDEPYNTFHIMGADIVTRDGAECRLRICRPRGANPFSHADKRFCRKLLPHFQRAVFVQSRLSRSESERTLYATAVERLRICTFILDESGTVLDSNQAAKALLLEHDGLTLSNKKLTASNANDNQALQNLLRQSLEIAGDPRPRIAEAIGLKRPSGKSSLGVVVHHVPADETADRKHQPSLVVYIRDPEHKAMPAQQALCQLFRLTPAEATLALQLANGSSIDEAGEIMNIRRNTVKAHLRSIFAKTGAERQSQLVSLILGSVALLGTPKTPGTPIALSEARANGRPIGGEHANSVI